MRSPSRSTRSARRSCARRSSSRPTRRSRSWSARAGRSSRLPRADREVAAEMAPRRIDARAAWPVTPLLALFDVDGTLFLTHDPLAGLALRETLAERYGV